MHSKKDNFLIAICVISAGVIFTLFFVAAYSGHLDFLISDTTSQTNKPSQPRGSDRRQDA